MVRQSSGGIPHWLDAAGYAQLTSVDRAGFAWEWLRRQPFYVATSLDVLSRRTGNPCTEEALALDWHLHRFEDPRLGAVAARPIWSASRHGWVLPAQSRIARQQSDCFDVRDWSKFATLVPSAGRERLLLSDGFRTIRLDVEGAPLSEHPVDLAYQLAGIRTLDRPLLILQRLRSLVLHRRMASSLYPTLRSARRLILMLRTFDALAAGAQQVDVAGALLTANLDRNAWRLHSPSLRSQAQRLVAGARKMAAGGFWALLD